MLRKISAALGMLLVAALLGVFSAGPTAADEPGFGPAGSAVAQVLVADETTTAEPEPTTETPPSPNDDREARLAEQAHDGTIMVPENHPVPVQTDENGAPMYMSQDGGAGEHASVLVANGMRQIVDGGLYAPWNPAFGETTESDGDSTIFFVEVDGERFRLTLERETP